MRFILVLVVILVAILLFSISDEKISKKAKILIASFVVVVGVLAYVYESAFEDSQAKTRELLSAFNQGKILKCGEMEVSNKKFNYEFGTASFVAKREFKELSSVIIEIKSCEAK
ncbi:hypothetical protein [Campylobacter sp. CCUG 57310]|uniref:hypothetical protein n=1 Tax=Campylobacter TaxID=194 RepID=UPI001563C795|nr:hypothetical protein [Campylobacter sp. CCUG 57310]QKF92659.1 putative membrane protein [Campylobacter sp. CCUG 57310]